MTAQLRFLALVVAAALLAVACVLVWQVGRRLRHRGDRRHELRDPDGRLWATRLHWGRPGAGFGLGSRLFPRRLPNDEEEAAPPAVERDDPKRSGLPAWLEAPLSVFELFDPALLIGLLLTAVLVIVLGAVIAVALAVELLLVLVAAVGSVTLRAAFGHPWIIEVNPPSREPLLVAVRGLRAATNEHRRIRTLIELGRFEPGSASPGSVPADGR